MSEPRRPIFWYQGLFLQPQHFQQIGLYIQSLFTPLLNYSQPYFWGACQLQLNAAAISNHAFEIEQGEFIFPDGSWVKYPGNAVLQSYPLDSAKPDQNGSFTVYVGLRKMNPAGENISVIGQNEDLTRIGTRFVTDVSPDEVPDLFKEGPLAEIRYMTFVLKIFLEHEIAALGDYQLMPVARLEFDGKNYKLARNFVPPTVLLGTSTVLLPILRNIQEQVAARCRLLEEYKCPRGSQSIEPEGSSVFSLLALRSLNRYLPLLNHVVETPTVHPWQAYGLLRQIIGELSSFTDRINALGRLTDGTALLPAYDHENLWYCFDQARTLIGELLEALVIGPEDIIDLVRAGESFSAHLPLKVLDSQNIFYLLVRASGDAAQIRHQLQFLAKVGSSEQVPHLVNRALPGIPMEFHAVPPPGLPKRANSFCYRLDRRNALWQDIQRSQNFCLYWDAAPEDAAAELVILHK